MPKIVGYPLSPFSKVVELANAVQYLGGSCTISDCADQMKKKVSGGFGILISSAIKHDLLIRRRDRLFVSDLYKKIKLSYNSAESLDYQRKAFLYPVLYKRIYERFRNQELPVQMLEKLLIREFDVEAAISGKIAGYFVEGLKNLQFLKDGKLIAASSIPPSLYEEDQAHFSETPPGNQQSEKVFEKTEGILHKKQEVNSLPLPQDQRFTVSITGNGIDSTIVINDRDDFLIVEAIIGKIKKALA